MEQLQHRDQKAIGLWLFIGVIMVFVQIILGGITRLTGSGLSITKWDIVTGALPPLNDIQWNEAFNLYKDTPQYHRINEGMSIGQFKFIFFWEFFHRLWARSMGFVFLIPFLFFLFRKSIQRQTLMRLVVVIGIAATAALFGWLMVASGLINRPWVNAYNLTIHLGLGLLLFIFLYTTWLKHKGFQKISMNRKWNIMLLLLLLIVCVQIAFGGFVSGMKSSLFSPTWPKMNGEWIPSILLHKSMWVKSNFLLYDSTGFMPTLVLFVHRNLAYITAIYTAIFAIKWIRVNSTNWSWVTFVLLGIIVVQVLMGIMTLLGSIGSIPVLYGAIHQGVGILFVTFLVYLHLVIKPYNIN